MAHQPDNQNTFRLIFSEPQQQPQQKTLIMDFNPQQLFDLILRLAINISVASILILWIFNGLSTRKPFIFSLYLFNLIIFIVGHLFNNITLGIGSGIGLFAIFAMLRYRSETLNMKEMTYLFILIAVGMLNSFGGEINMFERGVFNISIIGLTFILERKICCRILEYRKIKYNNLDLLKPEFRNLLMHDIYQRTGIRPKDIEIESVSFVDQNATLIVYFDNHDRKRSYLLDVKDGSLSSDRKQRTSQSQKIRRIPFQY